MTNSEFLSNNYELLKTCCSFQIRKYNCPYELLDDLVQDMALIILQYDNTKLNDIAVNHHENAFLTGILVRQLYSTNSPFYRTFRRFSARCEEIEPYKDYEFDGE